MAMSLEHLNEHVANSPFIAWTGMTVTECDPEAETLTMAMPQRAEFERVLGEGILSEAAKSFAKGKRYKKPRKR